MLSDRDISLAHPEAFDFVFGTLPTTHAAAEFNDHLAICRHCQSIVSEYSDIGRIIQDLPPHVEPPADLEDRTVAAILRALGAEEASPADTARSSGAEDVTATRIYQLPQRPPTAADAPPTTSAGESSATVIPLALWRRHRGRLTSLWVAAAAAVVILAVIVIFRPSGGPDTSGKSVVTALHAADAAKTWHVGGATGKATARQAGESWTYVLSVKGLRPLPDDQFYECWYARRSNGHLKLVSGGTFVVGKQGSTTVPMTTGVDPRDFPIMVITAESPGDGARHGPILLTGQSHTL
jgi:hypothetical protein